MSVCYSLYHRPSKTFIYLGKPFPRSFSAAAECGYNFATDREIVQFLRSVGEGAVELLPDTGDTPDDEEDDWTEVETAALIESRSPLEGEASQS